MKLPAQKIWSREQLLDLLDDEDVTALWQKWKLPPSKNMSKEVSEFREATAKRSISSLLREVLTLRTPTLRMLQDVLMFLASQNSALRTTGSVVVLDEEFDIEPQQVTAALLWSVNSLQRISAATWEGLKRRLNEEILPLFDRISAYGRVETRDEDPFDDPLDALSRIQEGEWPEETTTATYDENGWLVREDYVRELEKLDGKLELVRERITDPSAIELLDTLRTLSSDQFNTLSQDRSRIDTADRTAVSSFCVEDLADDDSETWKRFVEEILFLSDIEASSAVVDLLRMDLFRNRPQLYELWIVVAIIRWFIQRAGYRIEMLSLKHAKGRLVWNLNFSKSSTPIARLFRTSDRSEYFLFYQLFCTGERRDNMPDIALMPSNDTNNEPIWVMDPKHSERRGYSRSGYKAVGVRYQTTFAPRRTWIVEYYPRFDLGADNPLVLADKVELIGDVSPEGKGYTCLLERLRELHGNVQLTMAVVDVSSSLLSNFERVKENLRNVQAHGIVLSDEIIWFSDAATRTHGCLRALEEGNLKPPSALAGGGTSFGPVLELLEALYRDPSPPFSLRIYTDGGFTDVMIDDVLQRLQRHGDVKVIDFRS